MRDCRHPGAYLPLSGQGDWEIIAGRIGDELLKCGTEKKLLKLWAEGVTATINAQTNR